MPLPTNASVGIDELLTNMSIGYIQSEENYVAHRVFAEIQGDYPSGRYVKFPKGHFFRSDAGPVTEGAETRSKDFEVDNSPTYALEDWGLHKDLSDRKRKSAERSGTAVNQDRLYVKILTQDLLLRREINFANKYLVSTAGWTFMRQGTVDFIKWNAANSIPLDNLETWLDDIGESTGMRPNCAVFGPRVWTIFKQHSQVLDRVKGGAVPGNPAKVNEQIIAGLLGLDDVYVARATRNTAAQGVPGTDTATMSYIVDDVVLLAYRTSTPDLEEPAAGYTVVASQFDDVKVGAAAIKQYRMENIGGGSDRYEGFSSFAFIQSAPDAAVLAWDVL